MTRGTPSYSVAVLVHEIGVGSFFSDLLPLREADPEVDDMIVKEKQKLRRSLELIASENILSTVMQALGFPCERSGGIEELAQRRALKAFRLDGSKWGVNVETGSTPNFLVYSGLLNPHDLIMGLDLKYGGHVSNGFTTAEIQCSSKPVYFRSMSYRLDESTGLVNYEMLEETATQFKPKLIITGASAYPRDFNYTRLRQIADAVGAFLMMDMAHISGLIAASLVADPFEHCDIVTTTTHKSLRGPRGGMIFYKKDTILGVDLEHAINRVAFPGLQGGPHNHTIGGLAVCLLYAQSQEFKANQQNVVSNCRALAKRFIELGYKLVSDGSDNHHLLVDLRPLGIDGARVKKILDLVSITVNKNYVPGDESDSVCGGISIDSSAMTLRGFKEKEFSKTADLIHRGVKMTIETHG